MANLIKTPHPVTLEGQEKIAVHLNPGESLFSLLYRTLGSEQLDGEIWNVTVGGVEVLRENWHDCKPKDGQVIEVVGDMGRSALMMVAVIALTIWTGGMFAAVAAGGGIAGMGAVASYAVIAGIQVAGSLLINKVLGPKPPGSPDNTQGPEAHSLGSTQNQARVYGAVPILFGRQRYAPDLLSQTYSYFDRDDMYLAMHVAWGIGVGRVENLRNGDTLLSDYDDNVTTWNAGFSQMPQQVVPLFGNADSQPGGSLQQEKVPLEVTRTTSAGTVRVLVNISGSLYGVTRKGKLSMNQETFELAYRRTGSGEGFTTAIRRPMTNDDRRTLRFTMVYDLPLGQYDIRVRRLGLQSTGDGDVCEFSFDTMVSVQEDKSTYRGIARTGFTLRANERLSGQPTEINGDAVASPIPVWNGTTWVEEETSNPGAQMLKYIRGYYDENGLLVAGMGEADDMIDIEAMKAFMVHCAANNFTYNFWLAKDRDHLEVLNSIASVAMAQFTDANGLHSVAWVNDDQAVDGTINMARIKKGTFRVDYSLIGTADGVVARYWDATANAEATLRVPMPGVETMLSPATLTLEGVTNEAQAAILARYYLAQSLYQFKDVSFGVSLENLTFRRLSLLQVSHDMTQWGHSGVVMRAVSEGNAVSVWLDEPVPAPALGRQAYVGIRVPGQRAASVFKVQSFTGTTQKLTLMEPWPADLALPGNSDGNPANDSIWIYDFKETPGLTARVTNIQRAVDRSATVNVVQESEQFWTYVRTGYYEPANSGSLLTTRPTVSDLQVTEQRVVLGDVVQEQLVASWEVSGPYDESRVYTVETDGSLRERGRSNSRSLVFDISEPGTYTVVVIPYNRQGLRGTGATRVYTTLSVGAPPILVDAFDVEELDGGIRRYTYGFLPDSLQSPDFAGVEIRQATGNVANPNWDAMSPVGAGFFTSSVDLVLPPAGTYTFACRSRNTGGMLSEGMRIVRKTLRANLGEQLTDVVSGIEQNKSDLAKEINDRINADLQVGEKAAQDLADTSAALRVDIKANADRITAQANTLQQHANDIRANTDNLAQEIVDRVQGDLNTRLDLTTQINQETQQRESADENLVRMISSISAGSGQQFDQLRSWMFDTSVEGWGSNGGAPTLADGFMRPFNNSASYAQSPAGLGVNGNAYRYMKMRIRRQGTPVWSGLLRWTTDADTTWDDAKSMRITAPEFNAAGIAIVDFADIPWNGPSPIRQVRLALTTVQNDTTNIAYDWIAIGRPSPAASVAMVQEEAAARIAADTAEATRRESLAVQVRGNYEGDEVAGLQTGLLANERDVRIQGDQVNAQAIQVVNARMPAGTGKVATEASVTQLQQTTAASDQALGQRIDTLTATVGNKADSAALEALRVEVNRVDGKTTANAESITNLDSTLRAVAGQGNNLIRNGSIEQVNPAGGPESWLTGARWSRQTGVGRNGGACLRAVASTVTATAATANLGQAAWVEPGKTYRFTCWYTTTEDFDGTASNSKMRLGNQTGALLGFSPVFVKGRTGWTYLEGIYTVQTAGAVTGLTLQLVADHTVGTLLVDDVTLEEVTDYLANASAVAGLTTRVAEVEGGTKANAESLTKLDVSLGNTTVITLVANAGLTANPSGSSRGSGVYRPNWTTLMGAGRGFRVATINTDNTLGNVAGFDSYANASTAADAFNTWHDTVVQDDQCFLVFTSDSVGNFQGVSASVAGMKDRLVTSGALRQNLEALNGSTMFAMVGRKGMGEGNAVQSMSPDQTVSSGNTRKGMYVLLPVTLVNGLPMFPGDSGRLGKQSSANATAVQGLTVDVSSINGKIDAQATQLTQLRTDVNDVTSKTAANTTAVQQLTTRTTAVEGKADATANQVTDLNVVVTGSFNRGDNINTNSMFDGGMAPFIKGNTSTANGDVTWVLGGGQQGSAIQMVHKVGATASPFVYANSGRWSPIKAGTGRRMRAVFVARTLSGTATLTHRCRVRSSAGEGNNDQTTANLTTTWTRYSVESPIGDDRQEVMSQLWVTNRGTTDATVLVDRIEFYDVTDELAISANAAATQGLTTRVTQAEGKLTTAAESITDLTASINSIGGDNLLPNSSYEESASATAAPTGYQQAGNVGTVARSYVPSPLSGGGRAFRVEGVATAVGQYLDLATNSTGPYVKVQPSTEYTLSSYMRGTVGAGFRMYVQWRNAAGVIRATTTTDNIVTDGTWQRASFGVRTTVADVVEARVFVGRLHAVATGNIALELDNSQFQQGKVATEWQPSGRAADTAIAAQATAVAGLTTTVNQQGTKLDATAQDLTSLKTQVGNVNATAFSQLQTTVTQQGTKIDAQAQQINGVQASLGGKTDAAVTQSMQVQLNNQGEGGNLIPNSLFPNWSRNGWGWDWNPSGWQELGDPVGGSAGLQFLPYGVTSALGSRRAGYYNTDMADNVAMQGHYFPIDVTKTYCVSAYLNTHRCRAQLLMECVDSQGNVVGYLGTNILGPTGQANASIGQYPRPFAIGNVPQGTVRARLLLQLRGNNESDPYFCLVQPMVCEVPAGATKPPPFAPSGAQATATWAVNVRADGRVGGLVLASNGQTSSFDIVADQFRISNPGNGGRRTEYSDGNWRVYDDAGRLRVRMGIW